MQRPWDEHNFQFRRLERRLVCRKGKLWMVDEVGELGAQITYISGSRARLYIKSTEEFYKALIPNTCQSQLNRKREGNLVFKQNHCFLSPPGESDVHPVLRTNDPQTWRHSKNLGFSLLAMSHEKGRIRGEPIMPSRYIVS